LHFGVKIQDGGSPLITLYTIQQLCSETVNFREHGQDPFFSVLRFGRVQYWGGFRCYLREARGNVLISVIFYIFLFPVKKLWMNYFHGSGSPGTRNKRVDLGKWSRLESLRLCVKSRMAKWLQIAQL